MTYKEPYPRPSKRNLLVLHN